MNRIYVKRAAMGLAGLLVVLAMLGIWTTQAYAVALDTVNVTADTAAKKQIKSTKITVTMDETGKYAVMLNAGSGTKNAFYGGETSDTSNIDVQDDKGKRSWYSLQKEDFSIDNNVIRMSRIDPGVARYTLMLSIVNATLEGGYMKVEMKMENLKSTPQNMGAFIYWDTMIDTNDGSPFELIANGWRNYHEGFQVSAFFKDTIHVTKADALWVGTWGYDTQSWDSSNPRMTWAQHEGRIGQIVTSQDTAAAAWYDPVSVEAGKTRLISTIIGVGPKNEAPILSDPSFSPEVDGGTFRPGDEVVISGKAGNNDDVGAEMDIIAIVDDSDDFRQVLGTVTVYKGEEQQFQYTYTIPQGLSPGIHTLKVYLMDDTGVTSTLEEMTFYIAATTISGAGDITIEAGSSFDALSGVTAVDALGADLTASIQVAGTVNPAVPGTYTLTYSVTDGEGDTITATRTVTVADRTGPSISGADAATIEAGSSFEPLAGVTAADLVDGNVTANIQVTGAVNTAVPGTYTLTYSVTDAAGNTTTATRTVTVEDTVAPSGYTALMDQAVINSTYAPSVSFHFSDAEVGATFHYTLTSNNGGTPVKGTGTVTAADQSVTGIDVTGLADGMITLSAFLVDASDNQGNPATDIVEKDTVPPQAPTLDKPVGNDGMINNREKTAVSLSGNAEKNSAVNIVLEDFAGTVAAKQVMADADGRWTLDQGGLDLSGFKDGIVTIRLTSTDGAGNQSSNGEETLLLDTTFPEIAALTKSSDAWTNQDVTVTASINDGKGSGISVTKYVYGEASEAAFQLQGIIFNGSFTVQENGVYTVYARDEAGNGSIKTVEITNIDKQAPAEPVITRMPDRDFYNQDFILTVAPGMDQGSGVAYTVTRQVYEGEATDWLTYTGPVTVSRTGAVTLEAKSFDFAGNESLVAKKTVAINRELHVFPTLLIYPDKEYSNEDYTVSILKETDNGSVTEATYAQVYYTMTGMDGFIPYTEPFVISDEGIYEISVKVIDRSGNETTVTKTVHLDKTAPGSQNAILAADKVIAKMDGNTLDINGTGDHTDTIWLAPLGTEVFTEGDTMRKTAGDSNTTQAPPQDGEYRVYVVDRAGNVSPASEKKVIVDRTPPLIQGVEEGGVYKDYRSITISDGNALLNGLPFASGNRIEKNGTYTLIAEDAYGNTAAVTFIIDNDAETVKKSQAALEIIYQKGNHKDRVTKDVYLPLEMEEGVHVVWESSNKDIMDKDGKLVHPPLENTPVTLTATIQKGSAVETKVFVIQVFADITAPVITLKGDAAVVIEKGTLYVEKGFTALDDTDGDLTDQVAVQGYFNTKSAGIYTLIYKVADHSGNEGTAERIIRVVEKQTAKEATIIAKDDEKVGDSVWEDAVEGAKETGEASVRIVVEDEVTTENPIKVSVSKKQVEQAKKSGVNILFETENTSILIPVDAVDTGSLGANARLQLVAEQVDTGDPANQELVEAVGNIHESMKIYENKVFDFKMRIIEEDDQGNLIRDEEITNFTSQEDIALRIAVGELNGEKALMAFYFNPGTGKWEYVRSKYLGSLKTVEILTNHLSVYSVMELTVEQKREELVKLINESGITLREVLTIIEDEDLDLGEYGKYASFNGQYKNETAQDILDGRSTRPDDRYINYRDMEQEFNAIVNRIYGELNGDKTAPELALTGKPTIYIPVNGQYTEYGATASDNLEGDITGKIVITGEVDTSKAGIYTVTYTVSDLAGNIAVKKRMVQVYAPDENSSEEAAPKEGAQSQQPLKGIVVVEGQEHIQVKAAAQPLPEIPDNDMKRISEIYELVFTGDAVGAVGQIRITYDKTKVANEDHLGVFVYDEHTRKWTYVGGTVNKAGSYVSANIERSGKVAVMELNKSFKDLEGHWAQQVVELLAARQILDGDAAGNFNPNMGITRAEFATIITKVMNLPSTELTADFVDVKAGDWYAPYIAAARQAGIVKGVSETEFEPGRVVTREEMTAMVMRAYRLTEHSEPTAEQIRLVEQFKDSAQIGGWAYHDVYAAKLLNLVEGRSADYFVPESETLRGEAAMLIYRFMQALNKLQP
ncbi:immunoglobulin-like domain-containing protein [Paenibacillus sp. YN15]|uniref:immunoglobulin-like domain-containing protein n=1 Tax=Paenibacillus sp. YN15 TaxID=1742774 RepID=UPI0015EBE59A|nr:immunoglobulin-like domain-containing protein [Paenibacillus sp. YN15]